MFRRALLLLPALAAVPAFSTESAAGLDEIVVVANRAPEPRSRIGSSVTVISETSLHDSQAALVADVLALTPGLTVSRHGGLGQPTSVFIRGAESDQTVVLIDGVQLNDPSAPGGGFDFGNLLVGDISRIEILRGAQSTLYGSQAIGGVINIITAQPTRDLQGVVRAEGGSRGGAYLNAQTGSHGDRLSWQLAGNSLTSSGISAFDQAFGGVERDASRNSGAAASLRYQFTESLQLDLRGYYSQAHTEYDGISASPPYNFGDDSEYSKTRQYLGYAGLSYRPAAGALTHRLALQLTDSRRRNFDPLYLFGSTTVTFYGYGSNARAEYQGTWNPAAHTQAVFGLQHERSRIDTDTPAYDLVPAPLVRHATIDSAYLKLDREIVDGLTASAGLRHDRHDVFGGHTTAQASLAWSLGGATVLRASFAQGFKAPALYQIYSAYGNPDLKPEQANSWDAGIERHALAGRMQLGATYFSRNSRDLIGFFDCSTPSPLCATEPFGYYANISRSTAHGIELQGMLSPVPALSLSGNYTFTITEDRSPGSAYFGNELPRRPKNMANLSAAYKWAAGLTTTIAIRCSGSTYNDAGNALRLPGYTLIDLRAAYAVGAHTEFYGRIENAGDKRYETAYQYGTLRRGIFAGLRATF